MGKHHTTEQKLRINQGGRAKKLNGRMSPKHSGPLKAPKGTNANNQFR